jgi:hypothetical protein
MYKINKSDGTDDKRLFFLKEKGTDYWVYLFKVEEGDLLQLGPTSVGAHPFPKDQAEHLRFALDAELELVAVDEVMGLAKK